MWISIHRSSGKKRTCHTEPKYNTSSKGIDYNTCHSHTEGKKTVAQKHSTTLVDYNEKD